MVASSALLPEERLFSQGFGGGFLPLPSVPVHCAASSCLSRGTRQRVGQRNYVQKELQSLTEAVNWIGGCQSAPVSASAASMHQHFVSRAQACVEERCGEEKVFSESTHEAVGALLRARPGYADEPATGVGGLPYSSQATFLCHRVRGIHHFSGRWSRIMPHLSWMTSAVCWIIQTHRQPPVVMTRSCIWTRSWVVGEALTMIS